MIMKSYSILEFKLPFKRYFQPTVFLEYSCHEIYDIIDKHKTTNALRQIFSIFHFRIGFIFCILYDSQWVGKIVYIYFWHWHVSNSCNPTVMDLLNVIWLVFFGLRIWNEGKVIKPYYNWSLNTLFFTGNWIELMFFEHIDLHITNIYIQNII